VKKGREMGFEAIKKAAVKRLFELVEIRGVEPLTFSMPLRRSTN
jgi:hypothetical protein